MIELRLLHEATVGEDEIPPALRETLTAPYHPDLR